jgi:hypothetical protein
VAYGRITGKIYYTTLEITGGVDLIEQASATLDQSILIFPYFDTTVATLVALDPATGAESELFADDAYAYARIHEMDDGGVIFSRIESNAELQAAVENQELTADNWRDYLPVVDVMRIAADGSAPGVLLNNAPQYVPAE